MGDAKRLSGGGLLVFDWPIDRAADAARACLTGDERERAARFLRAEDGVAYAASHAGMRSILSEFVGIAPAELPLVVGPHGKPELADGVASRICFNLSHTRGLAVLAIAAGRDVGIDVERLRDDKPAPLKIAERYFTAGERSALEAANREDQPAAFYRLWTRKEAVAKLLGDGLQTPLSAFDVDPSPETAGWLRLPEPNALSLTRCWLQSLPLAGPFAAALACSDQPTSVERRSLSPV